MKNKIILFLILLSALFFYSYNLEYTYFFSGDSARDTLASLRILKNKDLTAIGPPLSFGQYGTREIYFGSLTYYMGALGLLLTKNNVLGPVYINIFLMIVGIIFFYKLAKILLKDGQKTLVSTFFYALSPVIVAHLRFFWNPNFIISLSPIFWYFFIRSLKKDEKLFFSLISGFLAGVLFNFHYFVFPVILISSFIYLKENKNFKSFIVFWIAFLISISPLIIFEIKNKFYLTNAIIYNFTTNIKFGNTIKPILQRSLLLKITDIFRIPPIFLGLDYEATHYPVFLELPYIIKITIGFFIGLIIFKKIKKEKKVIYKKIFLIVIFSTILSSFLAHEEYYLRYFFIALSLFSILFTKYIIDSKKKIILILCFFVLINIRTTTSIKAQNDLIKKRGTNYPLLKHMKKAYQLIKNDKFKIPYNITENFSGDARALYLRFFLEADYQLPQPENVENYSNLNTLFIFAPDLKTVYQESRWEFVATPNLKLTKTYKIDQGKHLFKFEKNRF